MAAALFSCSRSQHVLWKYHYILWFEAPPWQRARKRPRVARAPRVDIRSRQTKGVTRKNTRIMRMYVQDKISARSKQGERRNYTPMTNQMHRRRSENDNLCCPGARIYLYSLTWLISVSIFPMGIRRFMTPILNLTLLYYPVLRVRCTFLIYISHFA